MRVLESTEINLTAGDLRARVRHGLPKGGERSPGVHLSGVLDYVASESGLFKNAKGQPGSDFEENYPTIMAMGVAWEEFVVSLYPDMAWQPGEWERDEIYGTPDGLSTDNDFCCTCEGYKTADVDGGVDCRCGGVLGHSQVVVEECKFTTKKVQPVETCWKYVRQGMGYCAMSPVPVRHVRYHICWVHGNYQGGHWPVYTRTLLEFTDVEIEKFWVNVILKNKGNARREGA